MYVLPAFVGTRHVHDDYLEIILDRMYIFPVQKPKVVCFDAERKARDFNRSITVPRFHLTLLFSQQNAHLTDILPLYVCVYVVKVKENNDWSLRWRLSVRTVRTV